MTDKNIISCIIFTCFVVLTWAAISWTGSTLRGLGIACAVYLLMPYRGQP